MSVLTPSTSIRSEVLLLYAARGVRGFADGFAVIILPAYLSAIGFSPAEIGIVDRIFTRIGAQDDIATATATVIRRRRGKERI